MRRIRREYGKGQGESTYVDEPLEVFIKVGQIILSLLILGDEFGFAFQKFLPLLLKSLTLASLMVDSGDHQGILIRVGVLWVLLKELFGGYKGQLRVFVTASC